MLLRLAFNLLTLLACCRSVTSAASPLRDEVAIVSSRSAAKVFDLRGRSLAEAQAVSGVDSLEASPAQRNLRQHSEVLVGKGDFALRATVVIDEFSSRGAGISFDGGVVLLDDREWGTVLLGRLFGGGRFPFETQRPASARPGAPIEVEISRYEGSLAVKLNEFEMGRIGMTGFALGRIGFDLAEGKMRVLECSVEGDVTRFPLPRAAFSSADGDIDEFRDPSVASDGRRTLVTAIAVRTLEDGTTRDSLHGRFLEADGQLAPSFTIELGQGAIEFAVLGYAPGDARPWKILLQATGAKNVADRLLAFDSTDARAFTQAATIDASASPIRLMTGAMTWQDGVLLASATAVRSGAPRGCAVRYTPGKGWTIGELTSEPSCEPSWIGSDRVLLRKPGALDRELLADGAKNAVTGFEAGASAAAILHSSRGRIRIAASEPAFPYPLHELVSTDLGANWTKGRVIWGGASSNACSAGTDATRVVVFEGGDRARREHILVLQLDSTQMNPAAGAPASGVTAPAPVEQPKSPKP